MKIALDSARPIADDLRMLGYDTTVEGGRLSIRLSWACRVNVEFQDDAVRFSVRFGFVSRTALAWGDSLSWAVLFFFVVSRTEAGGDPQWGLGLIFLALGSAVWNVYRYIATESAINTVRYLILSRYAA